MTPLTIFKRKTRTAEHPTLGNIHRQEEKPGGRFDVNLVLMVREHGPARLNTIDREVQMLTEQITKLQQEREVIARLVEAANV
jgi:hypothetical protein